MKRASDVAPGGTLCAHDLSRWNATLGHCPATIASAKKLKQHMSIFQVRAKQSEKSLCEAELAAAGLP